MQIPLARGREAYSADICTYLSADIRTDLSADLCTAFALRWLADMNLITVNTTTKLVSIRMTNSFCLVLHRLACSADIINVAVDAMEKFRHLPYRGLF